MLTRLDSIKSPIVGRREYNSQTLSLFDCFPLLFQKILSLSSYIFSKKSAFSISEYLRDSSIICNFVVIYRSDDRAAAKQAVLLSGGRGNLIVSSNSFQPFLFSFLTCVVPGCIAAAIHYTGIWKIPRLEAIPCSPLFYICGLAGSTCLISSLFCSLSSYTPSVRKNRLMTGILLLSLFLFSLSLSILANQNFCASLSVMLFDHT